MLTINKNRKVKGQAPRALPNPVLVNTLFSNKIAGYEPNMLHSVSVEVYREWRLVLMNEWLRESSSQW